MNTIIQNEISTLEGDFLTVAEVKRYLKISQSSAYQLVHNKEFPVCQIGGSFRIPKDAFLAWVDKQTSIPAHLSEYMSLSQGVA